MTKKRNHRKPAGCVHDGNRAHLRGSTRGRALLAVLIACITLLLASVPPQARAQETCSAIDTIIAAGERDKPPFSSLKHFALPSADCALEAEGQHYYAYRCSWKHLYMDSTIQLRPAFRKAAGLHDEASALFEDKQDYEVGSALWKRTDAEHEAAIAALAPAADHLYQVQDRTLASMLPDAESLVRSLRGCLREGKIRGTWQALNRSERAKRELDGYDLGYMKTKYSAQTGVVWSTSREGSSSLTFDLHVSAWVADEASLTMTITRRAQ